MRLLIIDDSRDYMALLRRLIAKELPEVEVTEYDPEQQGRPDRHFDWSVYDVLLLDYQLGRQEDGLEWLRRFRRRPGFPPTVLLTAEGDEYVAANAIKLGAYDYINKRDVSGPRLARLISGAMEEKLRRAAEAQSDAMDQERLVLERLSGSPAKAGEVRPAGYRFVRLIGQGGHSRVYLAERLSDGLSLVLKIVRFKGLASANALHRFLREADLIAALDSPFVVHIHDHGMAPDYAYIALEFFGRGDLKQRIEQGLSPEDAALYLLHIAYGLQAIHGQGVIHRDLKPGNIMFRSDGSLALADFGISRRLDGDTEITTVGSVLGTPGYMSPEQGQGQGADERSDLYSAGVIFYEMLTGEKPFTADTAITMVYQHIHTPAPRLPASLTRFQAVLDGLLAKRPEDRFASAADLVAALEPLTVGTDAHA